MIKEHVECSVFGLSIKKVSKFFTQIQCCCYIPTPSLPLPPFLYCPSTLPPLYFLYGYHVSDNSASKSQTLLSDSALYTFMKLLVKACNIQYDVKQLSIFFKKKIFFCTFKSFHCLACLKTTLIVSFLHHRYRFGLLSDNDFNP